MTGYLILVVLCLCVSYNNTTLNYTRITNWYLEKETEFCNPVTTHSHQQMQRHLSDMREIDMCISECVQRLSVKWILSCFVFPHVYEHMLPLPDSDFYDGCGGFEETGQHPRLQLIYTLCFVLLKGTGVIWDIRGCMHIPKMRAHNAGQIYSVGLRATHCLPWLLQPEPGWVQSVCFVWGGFWCQQFHSLPSGGCGASFLMEND